MTKFLHQDGIMRRCGLHDRSCALTAQLVHGAPGGEKGSDSRHAIITAASTRRSLAACVDAAAVASMAVARELGRLASFLSFFLSFFLCAHAYQAS